MLRRILADALDLYRLVNNDATARGFRISALTKFESYTSGDKRVNLLQYLARRLEGDLQRQAALAPRRSKVRRVWSEGFEPQREGRIPERAQTSGGVRGAPAGGCSGLAVPKTHSDTFGARIPGRTRAGRAAPVFFYVVNIN